MASLAELEGWYKVGLNVESEEGYQCLIHSLIEDYQQSYKSEDYIDMALEHLKRGYEDSKKQRQSV